MKRTIKMFAALTLAFYVLFMNFGSVLATPESEPATHPPTTEGIDIVAVLDASGSMGAAPKNGNLPNVGTRILIPGLETLIDVGKGRQYPVNVGVVIFNGNPLQVDNRMWELTDGVLPNNENSTKLKERIDELYIAAGTTNQPDAVISAIDLLLENGDSNNKKLIVLFTDGVNEGRIANYYLEQQDKAIKLAQNANITISTIGFNPQGEILEKLDLYSLSTNGLISNLDNEEDITRKIIESFFGQIVIGGNTGENEEVNEVINVPDTMIVFESEEEVSKPVVGFTVVFDSTDVTEIVLTPPLHSGISPLDEENNTERIKVDRTGGRTIVTIGSASWRDFPSGDWRLTARQPQNTSSNYYWIPDVGIPNPLMGDENEQEPVTETTTSSSTEPSTSPSPINWGMIILVIVGFLALVAAIATAIMLSKRPYFCDCDVLLNFHGANTEKNCKTKLSAEERTVTVESLFGDDVEKAFVGVFRDTDRLRRYLNKVKLSALHKNAIRVIAPKKSPVILTINSSFDFSYNFKLGDNDDEVDSEYNENILRIDFSLSISDNAH